MGIRVESQGTTLRDLYLSAESAEKETTYLNGDSKLGPAMRQSPRLHFTDTQSPSILTFSSATLHPRRTPYPRSTPLRRPNRRRGHQESQSSPQPQQGRGHRRQLNRRGRAKPTARSTGAQHK